MASDVGWGRRLLALLGTLFGVLVAGTLIGIIASGVEARIERMRRGRSAVVDLANVGRRGTTIVVLADRDPSELNDEVRTLVYDLRGSRVVFRAGDPTSGADLGLVRLDRARAAIVLSGPEGDAAAIKSVLAIGAALGGFDRIRTVVEVTDPVVGQRLARACGGQETLEVVHGSTTHVPEQPHPTPTVDADEPSSQHLLVIGWNRFGAELLANWATFTTPGSSVDISVDPSLCDVDSITVPGLDAPFVTVSTTSWPPSAVADPVTTILMLAYSDQLTPDEADTRTMLDLMLLRRQLRVSDRPAPHIAVELLDPANRSLAEFDADDDVISQAIGSQLLAQLAVQPDRRDVLLALYATDSVSSASSSLPTWSGSPTAPGFSRSVGAGGRPPASSWCSTHVPTRSSSWIATTRSSPSARQ